MDNIPKKLKIIICNDDNISINTIINYLITIFHYEKHHAIELARDGHNFGEVWCGEYITEIAETKFHYLQKLAIIDKVNIKVKLEEV